MFRPRYEVYTYEKGTAAESTEGPESGTDVNLRWTHLLGVFGLLSLATCTVS